MMMMMMRRRTRPLIITTIIRGVALNHLLSSSLHVQRTFALSSIFSSSSFSPPAYYTTAASTCSSSDIATAGDGSSSSGGGDNSWSKIDEIEINKEVEALRRHQGITWNGDDPLSKGGARKKLQPRHLSLFSTTTTTTTMDDNKNNDDDEVVITTTTTTTKLGTLFNQFASVICRTRSVARKEVFETWAAALFIYDHFFATTSTANTTSTPTTRRCCRRVVDVAGGHGLLAWALLILDDFYFHNNSNNESNSNNNNRPRPLTAFCIDNTIRYKSIDRITTEMLKEWPQLGDGRRIDYVEGWLQQLQPDPSCVIVSVHACAGLSDILIDIASRGQIPIALVPCCHSRKKKHLQTLADGGGLGARDYQALLDIPSNHKIIDFDLADRLDDIRINILRRANFHVVSDRYIPELFSKKARLILGTPPTIPTTPTQTTTTTTTTTMTMHSTTPSSNRIVVDGDAAAAAQPATISRIATTTTTTKKKPTTIIRKGRMPPLQQKQQQQQQQQSAKEKFLSKFIVPCADTPKARLEIKKLSGRDAAIKRRNALHRKHHTEAPTFDLSLWLPPQPPPNKQENGGGGNNNMQQLLEREQENKDHDQQPYGSFDKELEEFIPKLVTSKKHLLRCNVTFVEGSTYTEKSTGRRSQVFRIQYFEQIIIGGETDEDTGTGTDDTDTTGSSDERPRRKAALSKEEAKVIHKQLRDAIPKEFPGWECR